MLVGRRLALTLLLAMGGCTGDDAATTDASVSPDTTTIMGRATPAPPALPNLAPCPDGWQGVRGTDGAPELCEPFPESSFESCADHEARFPGTPSCQRIGTACPSDGWPEGLPATGVLYVRAGATTGDGSRDAPFGRIAEATGAATAGDVIAVAVGAYDEAVSVPAGVTLWGACPESTTVSTSESSFTTGVISAAGADVTVKNLAIGPSERIGLFVRGAGKAMTARDVVVIETRIAGVSVEDHSHFDGERIAVRRIRLWDDGRFGLGINTEDGSTSTVRWAHVEGTAEFGVVANLADADATLEDAVIADIQGLEDGTRGYGLIANAGASLVARRVAVVRANEVGVSSTGAGSSLRLEKSVVRDTLEAGLRTDLGRGIVAQDSASIEIAGVLVERALAMGAFFADVDAVVEDLVVRDVIPVGDMFGRGLSVQTSSFVGRRIWVQGVHEGGVQVGLDGTDVSIEDLNVRDVRPGDGGNFGRGVVVQMGASLHLVRADISDTKESGIAVMASARLEASDLLVHDATSRDQDGVAGWGVSVYRDSFASIRNSIVQDVQQVGIVSWKGSSEVQLQNVEVHRVVAPGCSGATCEFGDSGHALAAYSTSTLTATGFVLSDLNLCGIHVAEGGLATLSDGEVAGAAIGACVQNADQPVEDLQREVAYRDNESNLQATMLPVPGDLPGGAM